jgi:hypothetical protein
VTGESVHLTHHGRSVRRALIGLLVVAVISTAAASGRKPPKDQQSSVSLRRISTGEVKDILRRFPEMVPKYMASANNDTSYMESVFQFSEVTMAPLRRAFPHARFYKGLDFSISPPYPYLMVIAGNKRYLMPGKFNQLLFDSGLEVTDKNIIELAKAFVLLAVGSEPIFVRMDMPLGLDTFPPVTFLDAKRIKLKTNLPTDDATILKVKIGERMETWHFSVLRGQFEGAARVNEEGLIKNFPSVIVESLPGRGQLDPSPNMVTEVSRKGDAQAGRDSLGTGSASGSETEEGQEVKVSLRRLSANEVMDILHRFPEMVPSYIDSEKYDVDMLARLFPLSEVTAAPLKQVSPTARFYKGLNLGIKPPVPYLMAVCGGKRYPMYGGFNYLLVDNGLKVTDENILSLAEAFVLSVLGSDHVLGELAGERELLAFRQITFLDANRIAEVRSGISYDAKLKVKVGERVEEWYFDRYFDEFRVVSRGDEKGLILQYLPPFADPPPQRGQPDETPDSLEQEK